MHTLVQKLFCFLLFLLPLPLLSGPNGFDLTYSRVPVSKILKGGPPRDGIPALSNPGFIKASKADYLNPGDTVIGVLVNGQARAYPLKIIIWHEIVNDSLGGLPVAVTYCPLCNSSLVFDRRVGGRVLELGVSGLLWNSNVLMYDKNSKNPGLWSQVLMEAVTGPPARAKQKLRLLSSEMSSWKSWQRRFPGTTVLSPNTGFLRNYERSPYGGYFASDRLLFPVKFKAKRPKYFLNKEMLIVVRIGEAWRAYAVADIRRKGKLKDRLDGTSLIFTYDKDSSSARVQTEGPGPTNFAVAYMYWFVLSAIRPDIPIYGR